MAAAGDYTFPLSQLPQRAKETARLNAEKREIDRIEQTSEFKAKVFKITTQHEADRNRYGDILPRTVASVRSSIFLTVRSGIMIAIVLSCFYNRRRYACEAGAHQWRVKAIDHRLYQCEPLSGA